MYEIEVQGHAMGSEQALNLPLFFSEVQNLHVYLMKLKNSKKEKINYNL